MKLQKGTVVEVLGYHDGNGLADVLVKGKKLMMFVRDIDDSVKGGGTLANVDAAS